MSEVHLYLDGTATIEVANGAMRTFLESRRACRVLLFSPCDFPSPSLPLSAEIYKSAYDAGSTCLCFPSLPLLEAGLSRTRSSWTLDLVGARVDALHWVAGGFLRCLLLELRLATALDLVIRGKTCNSSAVSGVVCAARGVGLWT